MSSPLSSLSSCLSVYPNAHVILTTMFRTVIRVTDGAVAASLSRELKDNGFTAINLKPAPVSRHYYVQVGLRRHQ